MPGREQITGLVLAGGRGRRMGGIDKGLAHFLGRPLAAHAIERLAPQVGPMRISANRNLEAYAALGAPVLADTVPNQPGPLAGILAGLAQARTEWLMAVPCDAPWLPGDLVERLARAAAESDADVALPLTREPDGRLQAQPVFLLLRCALRDALAAFVADGGRKVEDFAAGRRHVRVPFDRPGDRAALANANTPEDLLRLGEPAPHATQERGSGGA
jgi:molybdopterin-guanine dinucleotide biosynthesis protein A